MKNEAFQKVVLNQVNNDKNHGWGIDDSMAVIEAIWKDENGDEMPEVAKAQIKAVINPSQFRQVLAKQKVLNPIVPRAEKTNKAFMQFDVESEEKE